MRHGLIQELFVKLLWLSWCLGSLAMLASCAGPVQGRARRVSSASAARHGGGEAEAPAAEVELHPLARAVAAQDAAQNAPKTRLTSEPDPQADKRERNVAVQGIVGTLSNFDVRVTMEKHGKAFAKCHETRARKVPALAGSIEFRVHVRQSGEVSDVQVRASDLGDRALERCMSEVITAATFPPPHGGEADVSWNMSLARSRGRAPELWDAERVQNVLRKNQSDLLQACDVHRAGPFTVTAYVSPRGKVLAAGVAALKASTPEQFDCIAEELRSWPMPKPRKGIAKVSFPLRSGA